MFTVVSHKDVGIYCDRFDVGFRFQTLSNRTTTFPFLLLPGSGQAMSSNAALLLNRPSRASESSMKLFGSARERWRSQWTRVLATTSCCGPRVGMNVVEDWCFFCFFCSLYRWLRLAMTLSPRGNHNSAIADIILTLILPRVGFLSSLTSSSGIRNLKIYFQARYQQQALRFPVLTWSSKLCPKRRLLWVRRKRTDFLKIVWPQFQENTELFPSQLAIPTTTSIRSLRRPWPWRSSLGWSPRHNPPKRSRQKSESLSHGFFSMIGRI